jgi:hypothetical protein
MGAISFQDVEPLQYDKAYFHDYHGWRDTKTGTTEAFNAFITDEIESIFALSFFTAMDNVEYTVKIYDTFSGGSLDEEIISQSGTIEFTGFHTIELDQSVDFGPGNDFYVYVYLSDGGHPYDRTSIVPVLLGADAKTLVESAANPGESYYMTAKGWEDFYYYDDPSGYQNTGNFCIKALSNYMPVGIGETGGEQNFELLQNVPNPFSSSTSIQYILEESSHVQLHILDMNGRIVEKLIDGVQVAGEHKHTWDASDAKDGIYIYKLTVNGQSVAKRLILMR